MYMNMYNNMYAKTFSYSYICVSVRYIVVISSVSDL